MQKFERLDISLALMVDRGKMYQMWLICSYCWLLLQFRLPHATLEAFTRYCFAGISVAEFHILFTAYHVRCLSNLADNKVIGELWATWTSVNS